MANQNQKTKIKALYILKTLDERSNITAPFMKHLEFPEKKRLLHIHFGSIVTKQSE